MTSPSAGPPRRPDWSMDLLNELWNHPVDPGYAEAAQREPANRRPGWRMGAVALVGGLLVSLSGAAALKAAPAFETERQQLLSRAHAAEKQQDALRAQVVALTSDVRALQAGAIGVGPSQSALDDLESSAGLRAVSGPGILFVVDDAEAGSVSESRILDVDLRELVNGLWAAGAEAIAINGHRLSSRSSIRNAGSAITVNYRSLTRPYRIEAIGDPRTLEARFLETTGGTWWQTLRADYQMRFESSTVDRLSLAADPGAIVRQASVFQRRRGRRTTPGAGAAAATTRRSIR